MSSAQWQPHTASTGQTGGAGGELPDAVFAFPRSRQQPLTDGEQVQAALNSFDRVTGVSRAERDQAFANIKAAATYYRVQTTEVNWQELLRTSHPHPDIPAPENSP